LPNSKHLIQCILVVCLIIFPFTLTLCPIAYSIVSYTSLVITTPRPTTLNLWVNSYDGSVSSAWTTNGIPPYLNTQDQTTNYGYSSNDKDSWGNFTFQTTNETGTITSVTLFIYAKADSSSNNLDCIFDSTKYSISLPTSWDWVNVDVTAKLNTWQAINAAKLELITNESSTTTIYVDATYLKINIQ
jgi:hypothetical protein